MNLSIFDRSNLFAWCVASHDPPGRSARERIADVRQNGFTHYAWGNRMTTKKFLPQFDEELEAMRENGVKLLARWMPSEYDAGEFEPLLDHLEARSLKPALWVTGGGDAEPGEAGHRKMLESETRRLRPIVASATKRGLRVALYNHAGWFGCPLNRLRIINLLAADGLTNVGIVQAMHQVHEGLANFDEMLLKTSRVLDAIILSGVASRKYPADNPILPLGAGSEDERMLRAIATSGWQGPLGILNHTDKPATLRLRDNLAGLDWLQGRLRGETPPLPKFKTHP